jgi:hypothetical protein
MDVAIRSTISDTALQPADATGEPAHTSYVAFGMDRLAVAMLHTHGTDVTKWPIEVRKMLGFVP